MSSIDWVVVVLYGAFLVGVGLWQKRRAQDGVEDYFVAGRRLRWWVAGTSMIAASFASDTPLLVASYVREKGLWGNWPWWALGISHVFTIFFFARLWRRAGVLTEAELTEMRYAGPAAAALRGFKAVYWGLFHNAYSAGALAITGLVAVASVMTGLGRTEAILVCAALAALYAVASGLWGVVATDFVQFVFAIAGAVIVAAYSVSAAGGLERVVGAAPENATRFFPRNESGITYCLTFLLVQWWAWKNADGGGVFVQRMAACRDEREASLATLWFCIVHYAVRCWPWVLVALASFTLLPSAGAQEAYPLMMREVLPAGLRGLVVAWFLAEFMASLAGAMNWGGSLLVNDLYRRFIRRDGDERHYVAAGRVLSGVVLAGAVVAAFLSGNLIEAFGVILSMTAAIGVVLAARWLWWRVNAWSEIAAMIAGPAMLFGGIPALEKLGWAFGEMTQLLTILGVSLPFTVAVTLLTRPERPEALEAFYRKVRPPGPGWNPIARRCPDVRPSISLRRILGFWIAGVASIFSMMYGLGSVLLLRPHGWIALATGIFLMAAIVARLRRREETA